MYLGDVLLMHVYMLLKLIDKIVRMWYEEQKYNIR